MILAVVKYGGQIRLPDREIHLLQIDKNYTDHHHPRSKPHIQMMKISS